VRVDLCVLHKDFLEKLGPKRFVINHGKVLKEYVVELREEARTTLKKDTVKLIENYDNCLSIALQVMYYTSREDTNTRKQFNSLANQLVKKQMLETRLTICRGEVDIKHLSLPKMLPQRASVQNKST
jgi:hypothetical protein